VAWRDDLRPIEGVLQGTYAHLAIADIWRRRAARDGSDSVAAAQYQQIRLWTVDAVGELQKSGALTTLGERFVAGMSDTLAGWPA
jgi:uncharacterized protein